MHQSSVDVLVIGAALSGLCAAIHVTRADRHSLIVLEKAADLGGTWRDNVYPGVECDVPSHLYSYSFAPNPAWSKRYAPGAEILAYIRQCADRFGILEKIRFNCHVKSVMWDGNAWLVETERGDLYRARFVVAATGPLHAPNIPSIPGLGGFEGELFHTSNWPPGLHLSDRRIGMIGTGATAVQAAPEVAEVAKELLLFQRSPVWVGPKKDPDYSVEQRVCFEQDLGELRAHRWLQWRLWETTGLEMVRAGSPANSEAERRAREHIAMSVDDPLTASKLTPDYNFTCKRPTYSNKYYAMFNKQNVRLVTDPIQAVNSHGLTTTMETFPLDVIILATGFRAWDITAQLNVRGQGGLGLGDVWTPRITSYRSVMVNGFPNFFMMLGPNSGGLTSAIQMIEAQARFVTHAIRYVESSGATSLAPKVEQVDRFTAWIQARSAKTTMNKGCRSWWTDEGGYNHVVWPSTSVEYRMMLADFRPEHFELA